jgi:hypothetical protein
MYTYIYTHIYIYIYIYTCTYIGIYIYVLSQEKTSICAGDVDPDPGLGYYATALRSSGSMQSN